MRQVTIPALSSQTPCIREGKITAGTGVEIANQGYRRKQSPKERKNGEIVQQRKAPQGISLLDVVYFRGQALTIMLLHINLEVFLLLGSLYIYIYVNNEQGNQ